MGRKADARSLAQRAYRGQHRHMVPNGKLLPIAAAGLWAAFSSSAGSACSLAQLELTSAQIRQQAREDFSRASAVIDAEVVEPMNLGADWKPGLIPIAYLKTLKALKGRVPQDLVPVVYVSSCHIALETKGERLRILLNGEGVFTADQSMNGAAVQDCATYQDEIDRLAGGRRLPALAHFPGAIPPPTTKRNVR